MPPRPPDPVTVFVSYARTDDADGGLVTRFVNDVHKQVETLLPGVPVHFYMDRNSPGDEEWIRDILTRVASCRVLLAICSDRYFSSPWCGREWGAFFWRARLYARAFPDEAPAGLVKVWWRPRMQEGRVVFPNDLVGAFQLTRPDALATGRVADVEEAWRAVTEDARLAREELTNEYAALIRRAIISHRVLPPLPNAVRRMDDLPNLFESEPNIRQITGRTDPRVTRLAWGIVAALALFGPAPVWLRLIGVAASAWGWAVSREEPSPRTHRLGAPLLIVLASALLPSVGALTTIGAAPMLAWPMLTFLGVLAPLNVLLAEGSQRTAARLPPMLSGAAVEWTVAYSLVVLFLGLASAMPTCAATALASGAPPQFVLGGLVRAVASWRWNPGDAPLIFAWAVTGLVVTEPWFALTRDWLDPRLDALAHRPAFRDPFLSLFRREPGGGDVSAVVAGLLTLALCAVALR